MNSQTATMSASQPPKFSRYRSVRKAGATAVTNDAPPVPTEPVALTRAPSRYHRSRRPTNPEAPPLPVTAPTQPAAPQSPLQKSYTISHREHPSTRHATPPQVQHKRQSQENRPPPFVEDSVQAQHNEVTSQANHQRSLSRTPSAAARPGTAASRSYEAAREEARMILEGEYDRLRRAKQLQKISERNLKAVDAKTKAAPRRPTKEESKPADPNDAATRHNVKVFFDAPKHQVQRRPTVHEQKFIPAPQNMIKSQAPKPRTSTDMSPPMAPVQAKFDAPVSAVNAGERRVEVRCSGASTGITLPVTPTTSARDLLNSASICMSESFNPRTAVLVESFSQVGLERPLRRYERVRDVMNSWDMDSQNYLIILPESECDAPGLEKKEAPLSAPADIEVQLFHSQKLGKWDKRWIILKSDGQVTMSKHENDGEAANICHLSDFDVYTPTRKQSKKLKLPKKICFAIKSQQKSSMFLETTNFVHFFATGDRQVADRWYNAVQSWRSWYLVNVLGEGVPLKENKETNLIGGVVDARPGTANSQETIPYQLGSFQPLLDFDDMKFALPNDADASRAALNNSGGRTHSKQSSLDIGGLRRSVDQKCSIDLAREGTVRGQRYKGQPPSAFPGKLYTQARNNVEIGIETDDQAFTGGGLLGRSASRRSQGGKTSGSFDPRGQNKPLVDLTGNDEFADGSLLQKLEAWTASQGESQTKVDRTKRVEANIRVGEGA